jgi:hypothetical protein
MTPDIRFRYRTSTGWALAFLSSQFCLAQRQYLIRGARIDDRVACGSQGRSALWYQ